MVIGEGLDSLPGVPTKEPVFGLDAIWVPTEFRHQAELMGATVVDRSSVVTTHLAEVVRQHAGRLLSRQDVRMLLDGVKSTDPAVSEELTAANVSLGEIQRVLSDLLDEGVAIRDLVRILEVVSERARLSKDPEVLLESVRGALGPAISSAHAVHGRLPVITFEPMVEHAMLESLRTGEAGSFLALDPEQAEKLAMEVVRVAQAAEQRGENPVLMCAGTLRPAVRRLVRNIAPGLPVLSYSELSPQLNVETLGVVSLGSSVAV